MIHLSRRRFGGVASAAGCGLRSSLAACVAELSPTPDSANLPGIHPAVWRGLRRLCLAAGGGAWRWPNRDAALRANLPNCAASFDQRATVGVFVHQAADDLDQPHGNIGIDFADRPRLFLAQAFHRGERTGSSKRRPPGAHRVQDAPQAEQVAAVVDRLAAGLLGRHVIGRAGHLAGLGDRRVVHGSGEAEVGDLHPLDAVFQQDIARLHVAMDQPLRVRRRQTLSCLQTDAEDFLEFQPTALPQCVPATKRHE